MFVIVDQNGYFLENVIGTKSAVTPIMTCDVLKAHRYATLRAARYDKDSLPIRADLSIKKLSDIGYAAKKGIYNKNMKYYSNEIVFRGHPDKVCDQIAAAILQECIKQDPYTRAGIEVAGGKGKIFITGELTTLAKINVKTITRAVLKQVGYRTNYKIINNIGKQSRDIALGVDAGGAGDQGMMFGYACNDNEQMLPTAMLILQEFSQWYDKARESNIHFLPDGKAQITGIYEGKKLVEIKDFVVSYQNDETARPETDDIIRDAIESLCRKYRVGVMNIYINPTGRFCIGGFDGDAGLTGRKIVVDAYQSFANVGGGNMNGKDPTKVDFSAAHKARELACRLLKKRNLEWCEVQLSYAIGMEKPLAIYINSDQGELEAPEKFYEESTPDRIISDLDLRNVDFVDLAAFGHFR